MKKLALPAFILITLIIHGVFSTAAQSLDDEPLTDFEGYCLAHGYDELVVKSEWQHHYCVSNSPEVEILINPHDVCFWQIDAPLANARQYKNVWLCQAWQPDYYNNEDVKQVWDAAIAAREATCTGRIDNRINVRSEPESKASVVEILDPGTNLILQAQTTDSDGKIWWQTGVNQWVREDTVIEQGECETIPDILDTPVNVELIEPGADGITGMQKPEFVWHEIPSAFTYAIRIFDPIYYRGIIYSSGGTPEEYKCGEGLCRIQISSGLPYDTEYDWSIEAVTIYGSSYSGWQRFKVVADGPVSTYDYLGTPYPTTTAYPTGAGYEFPITPTP